LFIVHCALGSGRRPAVTKRPCDSATIVKRREGRESAFSRREMPEVRVRLPHLGKKKARCNRGLVCKAHKHMTSENEK
jgi:hypothetical protein